MAGTLYTYPDNYRAFKILIAAEYSGNNIRVVSEPPEFVLGETNKSADFLAKFPLGKVPAFVTENGDNIYESNAIAYYVSSFALRGTSDLDAALVQQYLCFAENELLPPICTWVFPTFGYMPFNKETARVAQETVKRLLGVLNNVLATRTFLVGERVTLADIGVCCTLLMLYKQVLEPQFRDPFINVNRWFVTCINQPQFKKVLGDVALCEKAAQFDAKKYADLHPKKEKPAKEKQPQQEKKPQEKKKQEKKPKEPEPEEEEEEAPKHVFVDPYLSLPKSPFVFDAFKRTFCNEDPVKNTIPYLWENFDKEGYSIWRCDYMYPEELKMTFMASNLVGGFFQRIEKLHKYGFAVIYVLGENYKLNISGFWILRGQQLAFDLVEDWNIDAPSYKFEKLDSDSTEVREFVNGFMIKDRGDEFEGKRIADVKIFK